MLYGYGNAYFFRLCPLAASFIKTICLVLIKCRKVPLIKSTVVSSRPLIPGFSPKCLKLSHKPLKINL